MGPTGTGKSALALELAERTPTVIINADAMQLVRELRILTARPSDAEMAKAEHALYGVLKAHEPTSVARWLQLVKSAVERAWAEEKLPLLVGGTGMYIAALMQGLATVPEIPGDIRESVRAMSHTARLEQLTQRDSAMAERLKPGDTQRIARALEVVMATGESLLALQSRTARPLFPEAAYRICALDMAREALYARLDQRFLAMLDDGALDEIDALEKLNIPSSTPILRAHGVPELRAYRKGAMTLAEAIEKSQQNTRNYAKRQLTWLRNQMPDIPRINPESPDAAELALRHINST